MRHYSLVVSGLDDGPVVIVKFSDLIRGHEDFVVSIAEPVIGGHHLGCNVSYGTDIGCIDHGLAVRSLYYDTLLG